MKSPFKIKMLYATTAPLRERAAQMGCSWALVHSIGHKAHRSLDNPVPHDDLPLYYEADKKIASLRRKQNRKAVDFEIDILKRSVAHGKELGLKTMIHCYDVSIPHEFKTIYPRLYRPMVKEYRNCCAETRANREPCLADPRVREIISTKTAEIIKHVPDLDAYAFSFNECLSLAKIGHRCELCRDIPFWQMIKWVADAVQDGIHSVNSKILFYHRLWGVNEHDNKYFENIKRLEEFCRESPENAWLPTHIKVYEPRNMHYQPSRDLKTYIQLQKNTKMGFIAKASWADVSINMPLNPWIKQLREHDTIVELSFESTAHKPDGFHVLADQFKRMAQFARDSKALGIAGIPVAWGYRYNEKPPANGLADEDYWRLSLFNFDVYEAVMKNPDADVLKVIKSALKKRYGKAIPQKLAEYIVESQHIKADTINIRGIRGNGETIYKMYYQLLRYGPTMRNWEKRISRDPANIARIIREKDKTIDRATAILEDIKTYKGKIPNKAYDEFVSSFTDLKNTAESLCKRQKLNFILWGLKDKTLECDMTVIQEIERCLM